MSASHRAQSHPAGPARVLHATQSLGISRESIARSLQRTLQQRDTASSRRPDNFDAQSLASESGPMTDASWTLAPGPIALCVIASALYAARWRAARRIDGARSAPAWRLVCFAAAIAALAGALISPVDRLAEQVFAMHMVQHVLLLDVVPVLAMLSLTKIILRPATPHLHRLEQALGPLASPQAAALAYVAMMAVWHIPALYDAALESPTLHVLEHICFMTAGLTYWWHLLSPIRSRRFSGLQPVMYMGFTKVLVGMIGIVLTFTPQALYDFYGRQAEHWGLTPEADQAVAGAIMALEQSIVMGIALAYLFIRALSESDAADARADRYAADDAGSSQLTEESISGTAEAGPGAANRYP